MPPKGKLHITKDDGNKKVELKAQDGNIISLKIDGKDIPKEDFEKYEDVTDDLLYGLPPAPPPPPAFNVPVPPSPPSPPSFNVPSPPTPPNPPSFNVPTPPTPPSPPTRRWNKDGSMKKEKDKDGNTILRMEKGDGSFSEIKIMPDREVYVDGKKMEEGRQMKFGWNDYAFSDLPFRSYGNDRQNLNEFDKAMPKISGINADPKILRGQLISLDERIKLNGNVFIDSFMSTDKVKEQEKMKEIQKTQQNSWGLKNFRQSGSLKTFIEKHLVEDGFLKNGETKYTFELTNKKLKINGKEQSSTMHEKYLKLYTEHTNSNSTDYDFTVKFNEK